MDCRVYLLGADFREISVDLKEIGLISGPLRKHWYYAAKLAALKTIVGSAPSEILDVGAGSGFFAKEMVASGASTKAVCVDPGYDEDRDCSVNERPLLFRRAVECSDANLVLMMDVLEHVPDDTGLVHEYVGKVASGTRFLITVPAFQWLWSGHDVFLGHYRRYTLHSAEKALQAAGLTIERGCYVYGTLFPIAATVRLARRLAGSQGMANSDMRDQSKLVTTILRAACCLDRALFRWNRFAGLTVMVLARKP